MKRLLYQIHRWAGIGLALFMFIWFSSGLVIMYAGPSALTPAQQLAYREALQPESGWLNLEAAWSASADSRHRQEATSRVGKKPEAISQARLVRLAHQPYWLVETTEGQRLALSATDGTAHTFSPQEAANIGSRWVDKGLLRGDAKGAGVLHFVDTGPQDSSVRNQEALRPFHRFEVGDSGRELLISARTGEVVRDSTSWQRGLYWVGNWIHLLRPLDSLGLGNQRQTVLAWLGAIAFAASLTGLIIGWQRWRPGWGGRPTYSKGRHHPYRDVWNTWHFWVGLIGGSAALLWALSGYLSTNPFNIFSPATASKMELARLQGGGLPDIALKWTPGPLNQQAPVNDIVELSWRHLGPDASLVAVTHAGERIAQQIPGAVDRFDDKALRQAAGRLAGNAAIAQLTTITEYDSYYYPRHRQNAVDRPLPVVRVELADQATTHLYIDPQDGQLLLKQDASRRAYRWLYSALHHWDFSWLYWRPLWDAWMLPLVLMGIVLGSTSIVLGWKRLKVEFNPKKNKLPRPAPHQTAAPANALGTSD